MYFKKNILLQHVSCDQLFSWNWKDLKNNITVELFVLLFSYMFTINSDFVNDDLHGILALLA